MIAILVPREDMFSGEEVPKSEERLKEYYRLFWFCRFWDSIF